MRMVEPAWACYLRSNILYSCACSFSILRPSFSSLSPLCVSYNVLSVLALRLVSLPENMPLRAFPSLPAPLRTVSYTPLKESFPLLGASPASLLEAHVLVLAFLDKVYVE